MPTPDKIDQLYDALKADGAVSKSRENFRSYMLASGEQGYRNRKQLYDALKADGAVSSRNYEEFRDRLGLHAVGKAAPVAKPSSTPQSVQQPQKPQPKPQKVKQQPKKAAWKPTWQEKMGMQMQLDETMRQVKQSQQNFNTRMENIRKGNTLGKTSEVKFNPESGKMERKYYTTHGDEVTTPLEQSRLNLKYRDEWEATTEEGRRHREKRIQNDFERRVGASIDKYDPDNAAAMVWQQAEDKSNEEFGRYLDERSKPSWSNFLRGAADGMNVTGGLGADNVDTGIKAFATHLKYHDLQRMADDAWNMLGKKKQQSIIEDMYGALKNRYPQATEQQLRQAATEMAREQSDRRMYELAVAKNAPKDAAEYFIRKVAAGNAMGTLMQAAARAQAGTTGDREAREDAEQRFEKQGHKVAGIAGTVSGFALDPLTWASAGAGGAAVKGTTWLGGKMIGEAAMRKFGTTLGGRMLGGAIGGAVNFGTYEAGSEALDQMKWGGYIDEETGERKRKDGFSFGNVAGRAGHGLMMGAVTGVIAPYLGNVSDKLVRATESTVGKMGIRAGELGVGTVAEGTIFAVPEIINTYGQYGDLINSLSDESSPNYIADEQERAAKIEELRNSRGDALMDVWTDNMAMIAGFKAQHLLKSAPRVIRELSSVKNPRTQEERIQNRMGFESRLRKALDGRPDLALTEDEKKELERRGYGDLKDLTEEYSRYAEAKEEYDKARPTTTDASRMIEGGDGQAELPYNRFVELMTDNSVSEAARAKMYYYLTGHGLPMSTVMGSSVLEDKDADGNVTGYTVQSFGANGVITSRSFGDKKRADVEVNRINRQAELNGFDVGERYYDWQGDNKRMYEACETVAEETGAPANLLFDLMKRKTEAMNEVELEWAEKILNAYNGLGDKYGSSEVRTAINEEFGVDVDKAIRKERNRRSEQEQKAVDEYASRLFADVKRKQEEAAERGEAPVDPDAPTSNSQIAALLGIDDGEQGDPVSAAFNRGHEADAQERQDIAIELAGPNNAEAQEAWNGVVQRINEDAAYMVAQKREQTKQMQHTDGSLRPAILKEKDSEGNDQQVYIVDGNVQMMPDGSMVDKASSDNIVVVYNPVTGERKQIDPSADTGISSLGEVTTAEQREADIERSRQEYVQAQIDEAQGTVRFVPGQQLVLPTGEEAVVVATDADGENITVALGDGTQATVQRSELQRIRDEKAAADYRNRHGSLTPDPSPKGEGSEMPQAGAGGVVAGAPADYTADMELTIRDEDGSEKPAMVMGRVRYENGSFVPDANGNIIEYFMDGEVKHDHEDKLVDKVVSHIAPQQPEAETVPTQPQGANEGDGTVEYKHEDLANGSSRTTIKGGGGTQIITDGNAQSQQSVAAPVEQPTEVVAQQVQEPVQTVEPQPAQPTEQPTAEPMPVGEDGEEDWQATTPERAHAYIFNEAGLSRSEGNEFIAAQTQAAQSALVKAKSAQMPRVGTSIKKYNEAKAKRQEKIDEAQRVLDYWQQVRNIQNDIQRVENERRAAEDAVRHDEAVAEAQAEYEARKQAEAERKAVGNENPMPAITEKWNNATKVDGHRDEIMLPDGTPLKGHYVLHESGASSPSHNPETWQKTDGFPMDANDNSVNDRDYERDHDAQEHTQSIARQYDQRALQSVPVVSNDGVVLSGNGRTMAGELAARDNTDGAYVNYLKEYAPKFGFTAEQVGAMQHPRVSFVPDEAMPYTAETFAKFNQQEMKSQNKTEQAVKLGKTVSDDSFKSIVRTINGYDTLGNFYNDSQASLGAIYDLHNAGVVPQAQLAEMVDGVRGQEKLSAVGREFLENMLIGKAFESDPEVVRMLTAEPAMRQTVITALGEIVDNIALGGDWSLQGELADAVKLCFDARQGGAKYGEIVSTYARQGVLFADPDELQTVADFNNATMLMLADVLNDKRVTLLKTTLQLYNNNARQSAVGQADLFAGGIQSREDILRDVITFINENYGKRKEIEAARAEAVERRKAESVQQDGTPPAVSTDGEATAEPSAEPAPVEAEPVEATEPVEAEPNAVQTALAAAEQETNTEPTEAQKEAGNYKKGHVKIDGYDVTIENPKGSVRSGVNGQTGQRWATTMQNTYGYIRGTKGVDGDHIDVFFSEDPSQGDVFVVDQVNKDGSFDEHKVMYGFPDIESARKAYLSNYEDGWQGLGAITPVSKEEFKKWIDSSHRKTKPFAEYSSVKPLGDTGLGEQPKEPTVKTGEDYVSAAERIARENEVKRTAAHFAEETQEEAAAFDKRVPEMDDAELLAYMQEDGMGDVNKAQHPSVYDEYDYRHGDEQLQSYDATLVRLNESGTTLEQAEEMLANLHKDISQFATDERAELLGQEEALQDYIAGLEKIRYDRQGNPVDADGNLILEEISSVDELKGEDFSNPTRNVQLPKIPVRVDKAIGAGGKPLIIKKNIFEKNARDHRDLKPSQSREILKTALYTPDLYGQNQQVSRPYNYVVISTKGADGKNKLVLLEVNNGKENVEIVHWHYIRDKALETLKRQAEREGGHILILPSDNSKEAGGLSSRTLDLSSIVKGSDLFGNEQRKVKKSSSETKIEDVGDTQLGEQPTAGYSIEPTTYTNKKGKTTPMHLVTFGRELSKDEIRAGKELAKESRGWWDREKGGFMMRDEDSAKALAEALDNEEAVQDAQPLSVEDVATVTDQADMKANADEVQDALPEPKKVNVESLMGELGRKGEAKLSDHTEEQQQEESTEQPKQEEKKAKSKWVDDADAERFEELRRRLRMKLGGQLNMGLDPEAFAIGVEMSYLMLKHGARKFAEFAKQMIEALGENVRPYLKSFYNGARDLPEMAEYEKELTPYDEVRTFDVMNFDKEGAKDIVATAEHIVREQAAEREAKEATNKLKQERNEQRKETEQEVAANTEALASEAAAVASEVESKLPSARSEREVNDLAKNIDDAIDKVNDQLALLGYYEAEPVASDFNEAYGYMRNAEKKAVRNVTELFKTLTKELGISDPVVYDAKGKKQKSVTANIAPAGGDVTMRFMLNRDKGVELYIDFMLEPDGDNLKLTNIMFRPERNLPNGGRDYLRANNFFPADVTMPQMLQGIRSVCQEWLPAEDYVAMAQRIAAGNQQEKPSKGRKSKKKSVSLREQTIPDLFSGLFSEEPLKPTSNEQEVHVQPRTSTTERERGHQREQNEPLGESKQNEDERPDASGVVRRSGNDTKSDTAGGSRVSEPSDGKRNVKPAKPEPAPLAESERKNIHNNHAERGTDYAPKGTSARIEANIKAIETMQRLIESGEPATPEDMSVLRKFSGWGGLGAAFKEKVSSGDTGYNPRLRDDYQPANPINARLRELLSPEAYEAANMSRNSAYYTPAPVIDAMWDVARAMGFRGGNVLEGSAGIGNIIGLMPTDMSERSNIQAVEIDETTGNILKLLYPDANVEVKGFEKTFVPNGSVDLAITNVPFVTGLRVMDETGDKDLSRKFHDIHDFCIAKNVRKLKEGGVGIFITSSGTLDSPNSAKLRTWLVNEGGADVVGAFRMHNQTFGGTGATSDIIVIRKRVNGRKSANAIDVSGTLPIRTVKYNTGETKRGSSEVIVKDLALDVNKHFVEHPEDMAGEMAFAFEKGDTYRATSKALYPSPSINQEQRLSEWAQQFKDMDWDKAEERESQQVVYEDLGEDVKEGSMLLDSDGNLCLAQRGKAVPINVNANKVKGHTKAECFNAYKAIKDALADVLEYQTTHSDDSGLQQRLAKLNKAYDSFVKTYGHLNKNTSISFLRSDMDYPSIAALESVSETGDKSGKRIVTYGKTDIFSRRVVETESEPKPTTIKDGIIASIYLNGRVDVPYIAEQLNMSDSDVRQQIIESGLGFENPTTTEMEVSYEYLSGNVREKLRQAQENNTDGRYDANIKALERVIPMNIPAHLIEFTLGSSWVEPKLYEDFVKERTGLDVKLTNAGGTWIMSEPDYTNTEQNRAMGVISEKCDKTIYGHELIKAAITCKSISVTKTISTGYGSNKTTETIVDKEATMACANKIDEIRQDFKDWARGKMQGDPEMSERMERVYNELFNNSVPKEIPDEFVPEHFGGAATVVNGKPFKLRPHQAKAVIRATTQPLMLAHEVGTGKTYTLISTAMEMRRLGTARKPMIVVQNATVGQFVASAKALYPNAKILTLEDADRNAEGRRNFYAKIRYNDWDMIVVPQSVFERIPDSEERQIRFIEDKVEEKMMVLEKMREAANDDRDPVLRQAQRELDQLNDELNDLKLALQERKAGGKTEKDEKREAKTRQNAMVKAQEMLDRETDDVANFDDMGIDALLIDEAHEYKHLGFATAMQRGVKGVDPSYSKKSQGVYLKTQAVLESKNGKNVVFATGTPISNTAAEIWTFMRYLMPADTMREYGIYYFDDFVRNFGNIQQMLEFSTNGKYKENNRFAGYVNLPELVRIWAGVADTVLTREAGGVSDKIPKMDGEKAQDIYLPQTKALRGVMKFVKDQLDDYEKMSGKEKKENSHIPLVMYGIAKAAAVDARLVLEDAADEPNSKTNEAVRQTLRSLEDTKEYNGTVAIFADNYQNKATGFNLYEDIRKKLIDAGVPEAQVVVMKSGMSIKKKLEIFDKVNRGEVRVIMGSTFTLGTGVNIQERLHTLIHVDAPNRPMDYTQRNGRILRQGNLHNEWGIPVRVLRFGVEDSLDVTAYQRLKTKGAIADSIMEGKKMMSNSMENRVLEEEQDLFGDITAQLSGSQYALLKNQVEKEVKKLEARKKQWEADQTYVHNQKPRLKALIKDSEERAKRNKEALARVEAAKNDGITIGKMKFPSLDAMGDYIKDYNSKQREQQEQVRTASGYQAEAKSDLTVSAGGFDFHIHRVITKEQKQEKGQLSLSFFSKTQMTYSCPELGLEDVPVDGQRLKSALEDILENVLSGDDFREKAEYAERAAERYKGELQQVEARDGKPFEYADELKQAKEKLAEYEELMKAEMAEKEAKYAEMDASVEAAKGVQLSDEDSDDVTEDNAKYRIREDEPPTKTGIGYKVFVLKDGKLYPPMVANPNGEATPVGVWLDADAAPVAGVTKTGRQQVKAGGKGTQGGSGKLAYRPGWHLGEIPYALQFNRMNPETGQRELFPANFVWAEVEYANDVDYQEEAMSYGMNASGKFQHSLAGLPRLPENGSYRYRTNPDPNTDPWVITGAMKVNRILKPSEVDAMVEAAGREPQQRQAGAITDEQVEALNANVKRTMQEDRDMMRSAVQQMGEKLHTNINIIEDVNDITHPNKEIEERRRRSKGWFDTATGEVVIVLPNNRDVEDVAATIGHETVAHKGLRELVGEDNYNDFLDETYKHLRDDLKKDVDAAAGRAFIVDATKNGKRAKSYEQHRRTAVDELFGRMAEKPFEEFSEGERTLWQKMCHVIRRLLDKFLGTLKLPKWFELGDNELRYMLWRSKERLERGKEHPIDLARDIVKREELGLTDEARYNMGEVSEPSFAARRDRAVKEHGYVHPGLNSAEVKVVSIKEKSPFDTSKKTKALKEDVVAYANEHNIIGTMTEEETKGKGKVTISKASIEKMVDDSATGKSVDKDTHLAIIPQLREVIAESLMAETHPDYNKGKDGKRSPENGYNPDNLIHRCYGAISIDGQEYRVKLTLKETSGNRKSKKAYSYEVTKIEVLDGQTTKPLSVSSRKSNTPNGVGSHPQPKVGSSYPLANLLQKVEKAHDLGKNLLEQSKLADESTDLYRDPYETEDIWTDGSLGLDEMITRAAVRLSDKHRADKTMKMDAMRAICDNLADLAKSMLGHPRKKDLTDAERRSVDAKVDKVARAQMRFDQTTVKRVNDLARVLISSGYLNNLTAGEVKRLLSAVKNSVGHNDIEGDVQKVMDIMVDNQLKHAEDTLHELEAIRGSKVDARGVEVQGQLDPAGAHTMKVFKKTRGWEKTDIEEAISEAQQRMGSSDVAVADEAALEYTGLQLALEYAENIKDSKVEERKLREEIKQAHDDASERDRATDSYRQYIASLQEAIRQNKIERAQSYFDLVGRLTDSLRESIANAKDFKEAEKQRIREIQHNANSDMEGRPSDEHYKPTFADKFVNNSFVSFLFAPLATFDQMLRMFGGKSANGEGYLYNRFMRGWVDARQKEINGVRDKYAILDAKAAELFGGKVKTWGDLIRRVGKLPKGTVSFWNGGEMQERELTQGNLMYIYMVNKMLDGRMKLRKMGITEENVADIEEVLDPRLIELADWLQDEFLVQTRNEYNETHKRMFGASMAAIEHYFPLKILANARADKPEDLDNPDKSDGISTATGSIIKRRRNALALDITGADALSVILDHVAQMEHWNAFAEFNRDINTLRTYKRFRNQVQNMTTIYGSGKELWKKFNDVCQMASGTYRPPRTKLDEAAVNFAKGVTAAKVSFRMFTALKQFLSMPAYIPEARTDYLLRNIANPVGAWKWSMEHLPIFNERWRSRMSGDPRLLKSDMDWKMWRTRAMQLASRAGMSPNAFVDALTVSIGAHSMYQTRLAQYLRDGYSEADAVKKAVQDAEVLYNQTQQSSEGAFTSTMQVDRSWLSVLFTVFRNASMSYQRQLHDALRNFKHNLTPGGRARSIEFMTKQLLRDKGIEPQTDGNWSDADWQREEQVAKRKFRRQLLKDTLRVATFGYIMQFAWNLGAYLPYLLFGDDEDEKQKMWDDVWAHTAFGSVEGLTGGDLMSQAGQMMLTGEGNPAYLSKDMPLTSDIMAAFQKLGNGQHTEALNDMINLIVQSGLGVNPQSITDVALSIMDACGDDPALAHEATICISRILQVPQSQIDKMYFDEVGLSGDEVSKYTIAQLAERYAQYKVKRGRFFSPWSWGDEALLDKKRTKAIGIVKDRVERLGDDKLQDVFDRGDMLLRSLAGKEGAKRLGGTDSYGSPQNEYGQVYLQMRDYIDLAEDVMLQTALKKAKDSGDTDRAKDIESARRQITEVKKDLAEVPYTLSDGTEVTAKDIMLELRDLRKNLLSELGITTQQQPNR